MLNEFVNVSKTNASHGILLSLHLGLWLCGDGVKWARGGWLVAGGYYSQWHIAVLYLNDEAGKQLRAKLITAKVNMVSAHGFSVVNWFLRFTVIHSHFRFVSDIYCLPLHSPQ